MRIQLNGLIDSASGPYGGPTNHLKLTTQRDGTIIVTPRKRAMTGDKIYASHAWSRLNWIALDGRWRALPEKVRAEWGRCTKRTCKTVKSNLDEFRAINMPRMILGFPSLRLPPDRFHSQVHYFQRNSTNPRRPRRKPLQVWASGQMKPEPPDPGEPPNDPEPFDLFVASEPHPFVASLACTWEPCPSTYDHFYDVLYAFLQVPFETRPPYTFLEWLNPTSGDPPQRGTQWTIQRRIYSRRVWYDDRPYETVTAWPVRCRTGQWDRFTIPWPGAWCVQMKYESPPAVRLSYGFYWRSLVAPYPNGLWDLAGVEHLHGTFPWPEQLVFDPGGTVLEDPPPCVDTGTFILAGNRYSARWVDWPHPEWWAGVTWANTDPHTVSWCPEDCGGNAFANATNITCCDTGDRRGNWWFKITVKRYSEFYVLEYRKPSTSINPGWTGLYKLHDPTDYTPWATPFMHVAEGQVHWPDHEPNIWGIAIEELLKALLGELIGITGLAIWLRYKHHFTRFMPYSIVAARNATRAALPVWTSHASRSVQCQIAIKIGSRNAKEYALIQEAIRRTRDIRYWTFFR